jgi:hypothetical protein
LEWLCRPNVIAVESDVFPAERRDMGKQIIADSLTLGSVTNYDMQGFTVPTPTDRYTLGDRSNLKTNADGLLDIYIQNESPGADKESNWLPAPAQPFSLHARLYSPRAAAIDGTWAMPAVVKMK